MSDKTNNIIEHPWGQEIVWAKEENYSGKILVFPNKGACTPMIMHKNTDKSYFINSGKVKLRWIDTDNGQVYEQILGEGGVWHIPALKPSSLEAIEDNSFISEVNNSSKEEDTLVILQTNSIVPGVK